jgi:hypothetical protein
LLFTVGTQRMRTLAIRGRVCLPLKERPRGPCLLLDPLMPARIERARLAILRVREKERWERSASSQSYRYLRLSLCI